MIIGRFIKTEATLKTSEKIKNNTICVIENGKIRNMKPIESDDVELVFIVANSSNTKASVDFIKSEFIRIYKDDSPDIVRLNELMYMTAEEKHDLCSGVTDRFKLALFIKDTLRSRRANTEIIKEEEKKK